jgi:hypothetical protein
MLGRVPAAALENKNEPRPSLSRKLLICNCTNNSIPRNHSGATSPPGTTRKTSSPRRLGQLSEVFDRDTVPSEGGSQEASAAAASKPTLAARKNATESKRPNAPDWRTEIWRQ